MLKLVKFEFSKLYRDLILFISIFFIMNITISIYLRLSAFNIDSLGLVENHLIKFEGLGGSMVFLLSLGNMLFIFALFISSWDLFNKDFFGNYKYITYLLPVSKLKFLVAKTISGIIYFLISIISIVMISKISYYIFPTENIVFISYNMFEKLINPKIIIGNIPTLLFIIFLGYISSILSLKILKHKVWSRLISFVISVGLLIFLGIIIRLFENYGFNIHKFILFIFITIILFISSVKLAEKWVEI